MHIHMYAQTRTHTPTNNGGEFDLYLEIVPIHIGGIRVYYTNVRKCIHMYVYICVRV